MKDNILPSVIKSFFDTYDEKDWYTVVYDLIKETNAKLPLPLPENELKTLFEIEAEKESKKRFNAQIKVSEILRLKSK